MILSSSLPRSFPPLLLGVAAYCFLRRRGRTPGAWHHVVAGNLLVLLFLLALLFLGAETYYRFRGDATIGNNMSRVSQRWFERHWVRNRQGVRDNIDYHVAREAGKRRITFLGDSFSAGHGITDVDDRFINRIRAGNPDWEVHGFAMLGLSVVDYLTLLERIATEGYELDVVVLVYCYNDIEPFVPQMETVYTAARRSPPEYLGYLIEHSYAVNTWYYQWKRRRSASTAAGTSYVATMVQAYSGHPWQQQEVLLRRLRQMVVESGGTLAAVTFPLLLESLRGTDEIEIMHRRLDTLWRELAVPHLDLREGLETDDPELLVVNRSDDHPSAYAHGLAAAAMQPFLEQVVDAAQSSRPVSVQ